MIIEEQKGQVSRDISVRSKENSSVKSKYDDFINFLDNVEQEYTQQASNRSHLTNKSSKANYSVISDKADISTVSITDPREAYSKVRERLLELEIEKEEQGKALELIK